MLIGFQLILLRETCFQAVGSLGPKTLGFAWFGGTSSHSRKAFFLYILLCLLTPVACISFIVYYFAVYPTLDIGANSKSPLSLAYFMFSAIHVFLYCFDPHMTINCSFIITVTELVPDMLILVLVSATYKNSTLTGAYAHLDAHALK